MATRHRAPQQTPDWKPGFDAFVERIRARLEAGEREYGGSGFERPLAELVAEIEQELADTAAWAFLAWMRLSRLALLVAELDGRRTR